MESTLAALKEVIAESRSSAELPDQRATEPTPTEFFALICSLLTSNAGEWRLYLLTLAHRLTGSALDVVAMVDILAAVVPHSATDVVRSQFRALSMVILELLRRNGDDVRIAHSCISALGQLMLQQDLNIWETVYALQSVNALLSYIDHSSPKLRKLVAALISSLVTSHSNKGARQLRSYLGEFFRGVLKACSKADYKRSLFSLKVLESSLAHLLPADAIAVCELAAKIQSCDQVTLTAQAFRTLDCFFQSAAFLLSWEQTLRLVKQVLQLPPKTLDMEANTFYLTSLTSAFLQLHRLKEDRAMSLLSKVSGALASGCDSEFTQVHCAVGVSLKRVVQHCISASALTEALRLKSRDLKASPVGSAVTAFLTIFENLISLKYQQTWTYTLDVVRAVFDRAGGDNFVLLTGLIDKLSSTYDAIFSQTIDVAAANQVAVFDTLGHALRCLGLARFLQLVGWYEARRDPPFIASRDWVLNLLLSNLRLMPCKLNDFVSVILPMARHCDSLANAAGVEGSAQSFMRARVTQLWSLLPGLCYYGCNDIAAAFPKLAPSFERGLNDAAYPDVGASILLALTNLVRCARNKNLPSSQGNDDIFTILSHVPSLMTAILNFIESIDNSDYRYNNALECVQSLASISPPQLVSAMSKRLIERLLSSASTKDDSDDASGWLSLLLVLIPYIKDGLVIIIYRAVRPIIAIKESTQKKAYLVLDALLKHHGSLIETHEPKLQILSSLSQYLLTCGVNARHMRLRCIGTLISTLDDGNELLNACDSIISEVLICLKDCNKKSRTNAMEVLDILISRVPLDFLVSKLNSALTADSHMRSAAITAFCLLILSRRNDRQMLRYADDQLPQILSQLEDETGELTRAVLSYIRVCVSVLPRDILEGLSPDILDAVSRCIGPLKTKFASRVRAIVRKLAQKVDEEILRRHMYDGDVPLLDYVLKQDRRSKRKKEAHQKDRIEEILGSDSDSEPEEETEQRPTKRVKAVRVEEHYNGSALTVNDYVNKHLAQTHQSADDGADEEDAEYRVVVDELGRVVVQQQAVENAKSTEMEGEPTPTEAQKPQVASKKRLREPGEEYRSKKAGGDVWRRGQLEPHAYIPLDPRMLSRKNSRAALDQFGAVMNNRNKGKVLVKAKARKAKVSRSQRLAMRKHSKH